MKVLVIGSGGREHALVWKLAQSPSVDEIYAAPGNGGTETDSFKNVPIAADDIVGLVDFAKKNRIDLVVPGPELPLTLGICDKMKEAGIDCFGPDAYCAQLEGSKSFAKDVMAAAGVPTAACRVFDDLDKASGYVRQKGAPLVVKADGLASGKGVVVAQSVEEALAACEDMLGKGKFGAAGSRVVIEEMLPGEEVSLLCVCDGEEAWPLPSAQDHKAVFDGDNGPNTGGMGAYSPAPLLPDENLTEMAAKVAEPILREMKKRGHPFVGVLYAGLMIGPEGAKVLEYNARFGDPECQPLLMRLEGDLAALLKSCAQGRMDKNSVSFDKRSALGVVLAAEGYPGSYPKGMEISGLEQAEALDGVKVFHGGTKAENGKLVSSGGRVLCVTALGDTLGEARKQAYAALGKIEMPQSFNRTDIGGKGIARLARRQ